MPQVRCPQLKRVVKVDSSRTLMQNLLDHGIPVASSCGGDGICGKCRMKITSSERMPPPGDLEKKTLALNGGQPGERLSCQLSLTEDAEARTSYW